MDLEFLGLFGRGGVLGEEEDGRAAVGPGGGDGAGTVPELSIFVSLLQE